MVFDDFDSVRNRRELVGLVHDTDCRLRRAGASRLSPDDLAMLLAAFELYDTVLQLLRLCLTGGYDPQDAPAGLQDILARALDLPSFASVEAHLRETQKSVREIFDRYLG